MGILFCPQKYCTIGWDPVIWSSIRKAGDLGWIEQIAPSDAAAGLVNPFWNKQDGSCTPGVWQNISSSWIGLFGRWIRFGTRLFRHRSGGRINSFGKRFSFSAVLLSNVFAEIDEFEWILTSEIPLASFVREHLFTGLLSSMCWASFAEVGTQNELIENIHVWHHIPKILC